jgi:CRP-like cAMP-binding protein
MIEWLWVYLTRFAPLGSRDKLTLAAAEIGARSFHPRQDILKPGDRPSVVYCLLSGIACRHSLLPNGRREITALLLPGDVIGLESLMPWACLDTITSLTSIQCAQIQSRVAALWIDRRSPISLALWRIRELQASIHREWIINVGTRPALQRVAHFFCETLIRSRALGLCSGFRCSLPLTQMELADVTAVTSVHVNRILMQLKRENLAHFRNGFLEVPNFPVLRALTDFDPAYLEPLREPIEGAAVNSTWLEHPEPDAHSPGSGASAHQRFQPLRPGTIAEVEHAT